MTCDYCDKNATVHVLEQLEDAYAERHLCEECAQNLGADLLKKPLPESSTAGDGITIKAVVGIIAEGAESSDMPNLSCPSCGISYHEFKNSGRFGCACDYDTFHDALDILFDRIHSAKSHTGKIPRRAHAALVREREITQIRAELQKAVDTEQYEAAAKLRDRLQDFEP